MQAHAFSASVIGEYRIGPAGLFARAGFSRWDSEFRGYYPDDTRFAVDNDLGGGWRGKQQRQGAGEQEQCRRRRYGPLCAHQRAAGRNFSVIKALVSGSLGKMPISTNDRA